MIRKELRETGKLASPKRPNRGPYKPIDSFDEMVIRNQVHNHRRILPTLNTLFNESFARRYQVYKICFIKKMKRRK